MSTILDGSVAAAETGGAGLTYVGGGLAMSMGILEDEDEDEEVDGIGAGTGADGG